MATVDTEELVDAACPAIGTLGHAFYFVPDTLKRGKELGLDGFRFYFLGRGGVLGDVEARVVASAFGYFEPSLVAHTWDSARQKVEPRRAGREYVECAHHFGRSHFSAIPALTEFCDAAEAVVCAADPAGLALFAGWSAEPLPDDAPARAMQLVAVLRELRGSAHLVAVRAVGLSPCAAHYLRRPKDFTIFGWKKEDMPPVSDEDRRRLADCDRLTDELVAPAYGVLDHAGRQALLHGLDNLRAACVDGPTTSP